MNISARGDEPNRSMARVRSGTASTSSKASRPVSRAAGRPWDPRPSAQRAEGRSAASRRVTAASQSAAAARSAPADNPSLAHPVAVAGNSQGRAIPLFVRADRWLWLGFSAPLAAPAPLRDYPRKSFTRHYRRTSGTHHQTGCLRRSVCETSDLPPAITDNRIRR
jgi:hypothetical protein